jgi:hypothetical protein
MPATTGMKGAGYYDQHSTAQMASIAALRDWLEQAAASLPLPAPERPISILDLGSSEGRNALRMMEVLVAELRRRTGQPLLTIYSDLPSNNFNQLFANLEEARGAGLFPAGTYPAAVGGSFYGPLLPAGTVHLATSFNSLLWLDRLPAVPIPDFVVYRRPQPARQAPAASAEATAAFRAQAEQDLVRFLKCRAEELVPGGKLLLTTPGDHDNARTCDGLYDVLNDACLDLIAAGGLKREQYQRLTMPLYFRTVAELLAPLEPGGPLHEQFTVERAQELEAPTPFFAERQRGDREAYSLAFTGFLRAVSEPIVRAALDHPEGEAAIVEALYERIRARLLAGPERYPFRYLLVAALLTRR